jgi:hypothetical protein
VTTFLTNDNREQPPAADISAAPALAPKTQPHFVTKGEHKFDRITYAAIGYGLNVALSLGAVYWVERTKRGQAFMNGFTKLVSKIPKMNADAAKFFASKSFFLTGGFAVLLPMKILEDNRVKLIKQWDREKYGDAVDTDPLIQHAHRALEAAPKQSWSSIISSRILALIPFYVAVWLPWSNKSPLAKATNSEYRAMDKAQRAATLAMEETNPKEFHRIMSQGVYIDRPIAWASRTLGKGIARLTGNGGAAARISQMDREFPGALREGPVASLNRDPNHSALPHYFISEAITSALVARGVYLLTRVMGPILGKEQQPVSAPVVKPHEPQTAQTGLAKNTEAANDNPTAEIQTAGLEHAAPQREKTRAAG